MSIRIPTTLASVVAALALLSLPASGAEGGLTHTAALDMTYKSSNIWAGWRFTNGPVLQTSLSYTLGHPWLGSFTGGFYFNTYGSQKDNRNNNRSVDTLNLTGNKSLSLGSIDEGQFFANWSRSWGALSMGVSYWHYSYGWKLNYTDLEWFGNRSAGELTLAPSYTLGPVTFFTEQNLVVVAPDLGGTNLKSCENQAPGDTTPCQPMINLNAKQSDLGAYHAVYGVTWNHRTDAIGVNAGVKTEWANIKFIEPQIWRGENLNHIKDEPWYKQFYHLTFTAGTSYSVRPWATVSGTLGVQYYLNEWIDTDKDARGGFPFAGLNTNFAIPL